MKEQDVPEAGILEKVAVRGLLWLEKHIEGRPSIGKKSLLGQLRDPDTTGLIAAGLGLVSVIGGIGFLINKNLINKNIEAQASSTMILPATPNPELLIFTDWQDHPTVKAALEKAKQDKNLLIILPGPTSLFSHKNVFFTQTTRDFTLAVDQQALDQTLQTLQQESGFILTYAMGFYLLDQQNPNSNVSMSIGVRVFLDDWVRDINESNVAPMQQTLGLKLSATISSSLEFLAKYGPRSLLDVTNPNHPLKEQFEKRREYLEQQFRSGTRTPFIKVIALNPQLLWAKHQYPVASR